ncbi:MAG: Hsp20/alpha crystallin family protein [Opitutales bacterium]|nr:Hsp20/alpha crystallin family protein [Opitutales bacterium]
MSELVKQSTDNTPTTSEPTATRKLRPWYRVDKKEQGYTAEVYLPGVTKDSVTLHYEEDALLIDAVRSDSVPESWKLIRSESCPGDFSLKLHLGEQIDHEKIEASFENGVLKLDFAKRAKATPKQIAIS